MAKKDISEMTVAELRARASELEITGRSSMNKDELRQSVVDAETQIWGGGATAGSASTPDSTEASDWQAAEESDQADETTSDSAGDGEKPASEIPAPSIGPHTEITKEPPEERLAKHEQSDVDAMGLDKRRAVVGKQYGASFGKQATVYGVFLIVVVALVIGGKLAADELDQGPEVNPDKAPWSQADAEQHPPSPIDFPPGPTP